MTTTNRRTAEQVAADRDAIIRQLADGDWHRTGGMRPADVAALVAAGAIEREVRREWDSQEMRYPTRAFGGAGVCQRHRAYVRLTTTTTKEDPR